MNRRRQRLTALILVVSGIAVAAALTLFALRNQVSFFYAPADVIGPAAKHIPPDRPFRLGGQVVYGSLERDGTRVKFTVTDYAQDIPVEYTGILPGLFREGQGVVALGQMDKNGVFQATELLAKHDEKYMPPDVAKLLKKNQALKRAKGHSLPAPADVK